MENLVHVRVEHSEAVQSKKELLSLELELVKSLKKIREHKITRINKLKLKNKFKRKINSGLKEIRKIQKTLPKVKIHSINEKNLDLNKKTKESKINSKNIALEAELEQIKEKLRALQ